MGAKQENSPEAQRHLQNAARLTQLEAEIASMDPREVTKEKLQSLMLERWQVQNPNKNTLTEKDEKQIAKQMRQWYKINGLPIPPNLET